MAYGHALFFIIAYGLGLRWREQNSDAPSQLRVYVLF
jgi:hypothetical protein